MNITITIIVAFDIDNMIIVTITFTPQPKLGRPSLTSWSRAVRTPCEPLLVRSRLRIRWLAARPRPQRTMPDYQCYYY